MARADWTDVLGWSAILSWLAVSAYFAAIGHGEMFQRIGAVGICAGVGYFAMVRWPVAQPPRALEISAYHQGQILALAESGAIVRNQIKALSKAVVVLNDKQRAETEETISLAAQVPSEDLGKYQARIAKQRDHLERLTQASLEADGTVASVNRSGVKLQAIVVIVATLQSGFGSLFFSNACDGILTC
jgi:hypothetical protein